MKASNDLFDLIKSLGGAEKGYFKKHSSIKSASDKNYLLLFDSIAKQGEYDEKALRQEFKNHPFARQFPVAKTYLYDRVLTAMDSYHSSDHEEIRTHLHNAEVLYEKGLYRQALKSVKKAKEASLLYDMHYFLPEVFHWELNLAKEQYDLDWTEKIMEEYTGHLSLLQNILTYRKLSLTVGILAEQNRKKNSREIISQIRNTMQLPELKNESRALTFTSKIFFHNAHVTWAFASGEYAKAKDPLEKIISLCEANPQKTKNNFHFYMVSVGNLLELYFENKNYEDALLRLEKFKQTASAVKDYSTNALQFYVYNSHLLRYLKNTGQFEKAARLLPAIIKEQEQYKNELNDLEKVILHSFYALMWFGAGEYKKCIHALNTLRNELSLGVRPDIDIFVRLFYIIAHYEAGNHDLLPHLTQSAYRLAQKQEGSGSFEKIIIAFFKNEPMGADKGQPLVDAFAQLKKELLPFTKDPGEKRFFEFFDYISWLDSKIQGKSFSEIIQQKAGKG